MLLKTWDVFKSSINFLNPLEIFDMSSIPNLSLPQGTFLCNKDNHTVSEINITLMTSVILRLSPRNRIKERGCSVWIGFLQIPFNRYFVAPNHIYNFWNFLETYQHLPARKNGIIFCNVCIVQIKNNFFVF